MPTELIQLTESISEFDGIDVPFKVVGEISLNEVGKLPAGKQKELLTATLASSLCVQLNGLTTRESSLHL